MSTTTELLNLALRRLESYEEECGSDVVDMEVMEEIRTFLDAEPEAEPVAWGQPDACGNIVETITPDDKTHTKAPKGWSDIYSVPLYTRPESARKPMTVIEIDDALKENVPECSQDYEIGFHAGARWAEQRLSK